MVTGTHFTPVRQQRRHLLSESVSHATFATTQQTLVLQAKDSAVPLKECEATDQ